MGHVQQNQNPFSRTLLNELSVQGKRVFANNYELALKTC